MEVKLRNGLRPSAAALVFSLLFGCVALAQTASDPAVWSLTVNEARLAPGTKFTAELTVKLATGWHVFSTTQEPGGPTPTAILIAKDQPFTAAGAIVGSKPQEAYDPSFEMKTEFYETQAKFDIPLRVANSVATGKQSLGVYVLFQVCSEEVCMPPMKLRVEAPVTIGSAASVTLSAPTQSLAAGTQVPDFGFTDFNGQARRFFEYRGKYVLLDFWATWCKPCLADIPHLKELYAKYRDKGFEIIGMDSETLGQDEGDNDPEFAKERDARARQIVSTRGAIWTHATAATALPVAMKVFAVEKLPTKILIDAEGKIVARVEEGAELDQLLEKLLSGKQ